MKKGELPDRLTAFLQVSECLPEPPGFEPPHLAEEICRERLEEIPVEGHLRSCGHLGTPKPEIPRAKPTFAGATGWSAAMRLPLGPGGFTLQTQQLSISGGSSSQLFLSPLTR